MELIETIPFIHFLFISQGMYEIGPCLAIRVVVLIIPQLVAL
jgi:hypothetical protein